MAALVCLSLFALLAPAAHAQRRGRDAQQQKLSPYTVKGRIVGMRGNLIQWADEEQQRAGLVMLDRKEIQRVTVTGTAEPSFLQPGLFVRFTTTPDERGRVTEPVTKLEIFSPADGFQAGVFPEDPANPSGPVLVSGQIKSVRKNALTIHTGRDTVKAELAEEPEITIEVSQLNIVSPGDHLEVFGVGPGPEKLIAKTVDIQLANPLTGPKKRRR